MLALLVAAALAGDLVPPTLIGCPDVTWPPGLDREPPVVDLLLELDAEGAVLAAIVVTGEDPFALRAKSGALRCTFAPATDDGLPVPVDVPFRWTFPPAPVNVTGRVRSPTGEPVAGVAIALGDRAITTAADGSFAVRNLAPGAWVARPSRAGWQIGEHPFTLAEGEAVDLQLVALPAAESAPEGVGTWRAPPTTTVRTLDRDAVRAQPGSLGDPIRALAGQPGLVRTPFDAGWLLVRGGGPNDTNVYVDGVRVPLLFHLGGLTSVLPADLISSVSLEPGVTDPRYGRASAGAVNVGLAPIEGPTVAGGVNLAWSQALASVPVGDAALQVGVRRSYLDGVLALALGPERARIAPTFWDALVRADSDRAGVLALAMSDMIDAPTGDGDETITIVMQSAHVQGRIEPAIASIRPWIGTQRRQLVTDGRDESESQSFAGARVDVPVGPIDLGVEAELRDYAIERDDVARGGRLGHADPYASLAAGDDARVELGMRLDTLFVAGQLSRVGPSPRIATRLAVRGPWSVDAEAGVAHAPPPALFLVGFSEGPYLRLSRTAQVGAGLRRDGDWTLDLRGWHRRGERVAGIEADGSFGEFDHRAAGGEGLIEGTLAGINARAVLFVSRSTRREERGDLFVPTRYDQPVLLQLGAARDLGRGFSAGLRWRFGSGYPRDPEVTSVYDLLTQEERDLDVSSDRLPPFHALDVRLDRSWTWRTGWLDAYIDLQSVYGRRVPEPAINGIDDTDVAYGYGLPFLPIFGVEGGWRRP